MTILRNKYAMKLPKSYLVFILIILSLGCKTLPKSIPTGTWNYKLLTNGVQLGSAVISNKISNGTYISTSELSFGSGKIINTSRQIITETLDFKPVKLENYNKIIDGSREQTIDTIATFKGREIEIQAGNNKSTVKIEKDFLLDGNYNIAKLIENKFKAGFKQSYFIYDPTIEIDSVIPVSVRVIGTETLRINEKKERVIHIVQSIEGIKSADTYLNEKGVMVKAVIQMLNLKIELVKE
jgi:hypothetical protein